MLVSSSKRFTRCLSRAASNLAVVPDAPRANGCARLRTERAARRTPRR